MPAWKPCSACARCWSWRPIFRPCRARAGWPTGKLRITTSLSFAMACLTQAIVDLQRQYPRFPGRATEMYAYTDYSHFARWAGTPWMKRGDDYLAPKAVIRQRLLDELFRHVPAAKHIEKRASAKVGRCFRRLHAHGLIAKIPRTRRWRVTDYGRKVMGTTTYLREHHFPNVYAGVMH